jgi:peptidoglycan/LPS O-acetylase OafA/YrhL
MKRAPGRKLACVDSLRGLAIVGVILFHLRGGDGTPYHPAIAALLAPFRFGYTGVHLFLVLSGFCLTHSLIRRERSGRPMGLRSYLAARWWRIAPPYYAAIALYLAIPVAYVLVGHPSPLTRLLSVRQVATHVLFIHGWWADTFGAINVPFWTLSLEFQFYLTLPLLFALAGRLGCVPVVAAVAATSVAWRALILAAGPRWGHLIGGAFPGRWTEFALGMGVAFWYNRPRGAASVRASWPWLAATAMGLLAAAMAMTAYRPVEPAVDYIFGAGFAALLAATLEAAERGGRPAEVVEFAPLVGVGLVSYSLYLSHSLFMERTIQLYRRAIPRPTLVSDAAMVAAVLGAVAVGGWLFYRWVERHFVRSIDAPRPAAQASSPGPALRGAPSITAAEA